MLKNESVNPNFKTFSSFWVPFSAILANLEKITWILKELWGFTFVIADFVANHGLDHVTLSFWYRGRQISHIFQSPVEEKQAHEPMVLFTYLGFGWVKVTVWKVSRK